MQGIHAETNLHEVYDAKQRIHLERKMHMSATLSVFGRAFVTACANTTAPRMLAVAMAAAMSVSSPAAHADEYLTGDAPVPMRTSEGGQMEEGGAQVGRWVGGAVGAVGTGAVALAVGANKYFAAAAAVLGGIGGAKVGERMANANGQPQGQVARVDFPGEEPQPRGLEGAVGTERSMIFPQVVGRTDQPRMSQESIRSYDNLAVTAAAYRLLAQASYSEFLSVKEQFVLNPRNADVSRRFLEAKKSLEGDIAGLNIALADFSNATQTLRQRYPGNDFGGYQALSMSISAPAQVRAREVEPDRPIHPFAEAMAMQIRSGEVPRVTAAAPGYATGDGVLRSAIVRQDMGRPLQQSGRGSMANPSDTLHRLSLGMR